VWGTYGKRLELALRQFPEPVPDGVRLGDPELLA
jgi:hypothetical protein